MDKKQMAHDYAKAILEASQRNKFDVLATKDITYVDQQGFVITRDAGDMSKIAQDAWALADAMEAEELKRLDTSRPDVLQDEPKKVDWNDAPEWANYLFHDSITLAPTWAENAPIETRPRSFAERRAVTGAPGRSRRAGVAYLWVSDLSGTVYERPANA